MNIYDSNSVNRINHELKRIDDENYSRRSKEANELGKRANGISGNRWRLIILGAGE